MSKAVAFIDWISYTRMNDAKLLEYPSEFGGLAREVLFEWLRFNEGTEATVDETTPVKPNRPFQYARQNTRTLSRIEWGGGSDRAFISFSGEGCKHLRLTNKTQKVLEKVCSWVSRIDLSVDIESDTKPMDFCAKRSKEKHKNGAVMYEPQGTTQYVGSWASDRFARVYRYNPPHERAAFVRVEHVFKGKQAKVIASKLVSLSPICLIETVGEIYGWTHDDWVMACKAAGTPEEVEWYKAEKHEGKTLKWLQETCIPAVIRLVREGEISDPVEWFKANLEALGYTDTGNDRQQ